ncbi:hypothetical protein OKW41_002487 [Paraburkholderia sp. UCT70]
MTERADRHRVRVAGDGARTERDRVGRGRNAFAPTADEPAPLACAPDPSATLPPTPPSVTLAWDALSYSTASLAIAATACNWLTLTASVGAVPAATPVSWLAPAVPMKSPTLPPVFAPTVIVPLPGAPPTCCTRPTVPLAMPVDSAVTLLDAVARPVDNDARLLLVDVTSVCAC